MRLTRSLVSALSAEGPKLLEQAGLCLAPSGRSRLMRHVSRAELVAAIGKPCVYCGEPMDYPTRDHIRALSQGGTLEAPNKALACDRCNHDKGSWTTQILAVPAPHGERRAPPSWPAAR